MATTKPKQPLTLEAIRAADDTQATTGQEVDVPEWGGVARIRGLTRGEVRGIPDEAKEAEAHALHCCLLEPKLTLEEARELLEAKGFAATERLLDAILEVSGLRGGFRAGAAD